MEELRHLRQRPRFPLRVSCCCDGDGGGDGGDGACGASRTSRPHRRKKEHADACDVTLGRRSPSGNLGLGVGLGFWVL